MTVPDGASLIVSRSWFAPDMKPVEMAIVAPWIAVVSTSLTLMELITATRVVSPELGPDDASVTAPPALLAAVSVGA